MTTAFLSVVIGWYLVVVGTLLLFQRKNVIAAMTEVLEHRGLFFILAIFTLIIGLLMVASHNFWMMGWPVAITVFSWFVLLTGVFRLFCQERAMRMTKSFVDHPAGIIVSGIVSFILGVLFLAYAYCLCT